MLRPSESGCNKLLSEYGRCNAFFTRKLRFNIFHIVYVLVALVRERTAKHMLTRSVQALMHLGTYLGRLNLVMPPPPPRWPWALLTTNCDVIQISVTHILTHAKKPVHASVLCRFTSLLVNQHLFLNSYHYQNRLRSHFSAPLWLPPARQASTFTTFLQSWTLHHSTCIYFTACGHVFICLSSVLFPLNLSAFLFSWGSLTPLTQLLAHFTLSIKGHNMLE